MRGKIPDIWQIKRFWIKCYTVLYFPLIITRTYYHYFIIINPYNYFQEFGTLIMRDTLNVSNDLECVIT